MYRLDDVQYMTEALRLAREGTALASPNPRVGAVVVKDGRIVGRGTHRYTELTHAEVLALAEAGEAARGGELYLNLEPCSHTGRTPPCVEAVLAAGIGRVVAAMADPNPRVAGEGLRRLGEAGVKVETGCMGREAKQLNEDFAQWIGTGLPFVTWKAAASLDGRIAFPPGAGDGRRWISSTPARERVQLLRHERDAVLTGIGTVLADDPLLTDRTKKPRRRPLLRVILDAELRLPLESNLVKTARREKGVTVFCARANEERRLALEKRGVRVCVAPPGAGGEGVDLEAVLRQLGGEEITSLLLEGGARLNGRMLAGGWVDKMILFQAPLLLGDAARPLTAGLPLPPARSLVGPVTAECIGPDVMIETYFHPRATPEEATCSPA